MDRAEKIRLCAQMRNELEGIEDPEEMFGVAIDYSKKTDEQLDFELIWLDDMLGK